MLVDLRGETMPDKVIYLDMDGVLADFLESFFDIHERYDLTERYKNGEFPTNWDFDGELGDEEDWWKPVREKGQVSFWENINPYPYSGNVVKMVKNTGLPWYICTTPYYGNSDCVYGKITWLHKYLGPIENIIMMKDKYRLAHENAFLIDDSDKNVEKFILAGGQACLFPQLWNAARTSSPDKLDVLRSCLDFFLQEEPCLR
jgi:5'(3')-deoxyribonucleotidase